LLQAVLGFDNLLYISIESKRAPLERQAEVRRWGIGIAILLRIVLLYIVIKLIHSFHNTILHIGFTNIIEGEFNLHSIIMIFGGIFIIYTAMKEILHMMVLSAHGPEEQNSKSVGMIIFLIVSMNVVFSFDSILSAMALTEVFWVMASAIVIGGLLMIWMADHVAQFLEKNRMYEVLGLFILFVVGIMLLSDGGHMAHLHLFGYAITPMSKATFYFIIGILILIDIVQSRYQKKLLMSSKR
jgi:predicted tellurium resistance membrane protein TerC|tara:strand:+ start:969 stop:1691 length:723 start_codon:yes stop_codon:yes gene_type:complete